MGGAESRYSGAVGQRRRGLGRLSLAYVREPGPPDSRAGGHGSVHDRGHVWIGAAVWNRRSGAGSGVDRCPHQLPMSAAGAGGLAAVALQSDVSSLARALRCEPGSDSGGAAVGPVVGFASGVVVDWLCIGGVLRIFLRISTAGWIGQ